MTTAYVSDLTIRLGPATTTGSLLPIRNKEDKQKFYSLSPNTRGRVKRVFVDDEGTIFEEGELLKATLDENKEYHIVDREKLKETRKATLPKNLMVVTVHDLAEVEDVLFPSDSNAYLFYPNPNDPANAGWADFIIAGINSGKKAFLAKVNLRGYEGLFRLSLYRGRLCLQKQLYLWELNDHEAQALDMPKTMRAKVVKAIDSMTEPFDPESYDDQREVALRSLADEAQSGNEEAPAPVKKSTKAAAKSFNLAEALETLEAFK